MDRSFEEKFDRHIERIDRFIERSDREMRTTQELQARYMRESQENIRGYRMMTSKLIRVVDENIEAMREMREASQAHTKAIYALLDRFNNGGASPATG